MAKVMTNKGFTIGEILKDKGIILTSKTTDDGATVVSIKRTKETVPSQKDSTPKCLALMKPHFKKLEQHSKEQMQKAIISGCDPDYILKSSKEMGDKEPVFEWNDKGMLVFVGKKETKKKAA